MEQQSARLRNTGFLTFFFSGICAISAGVVVSLLQERYGFAYGMTGTLLSLMSVGNLLAGLLIGMLPSVLGMKPSVLLLTIGYAVGYGIMGLTGAVAVLGLAGGAHQAWSASVYTLGSDMFPKSDVASITGLSGMAGQIGSVLFQTAVGFTLSWFAAQGNASHGYDIIFMVCGSAYLAAFVIFSLIIPNINMVAPRER